jgi:hypothetical protein
MKLRERRSARVRFWASGTLGIALAVLAGGRGAGGQSMPTGVRVADRTTGVAASCVAVTPAEQFRDARLVFDGTMLPGRVVVLGRTRFLSSPARVRVLRYLKGRGPSAVRVQTGLRAVRNGVVGNSEGIEPRAGERWRIYTDNARQPFATTICSGSRRLRPR